MIIMLLYVLERLPFVYSVFLFIYFFFWGGGGGNHRVSFRYFTIGDEMRRMP